MIDRVHKLLVKAKHTDKVCFQEEIALCYVFLASDDGSYMTEQVLHPNGGEIVNG